MFWTARGPSGRSRWRRLSTYSLVLVVAAFVLLGVTQAGLGFAAGSSTASITSDKADYNPGSTVTLTGAGWAASEAVHITVDDSVGQTWSYATDVTADSGGGFTTQFVLPSYFVAAYGVTATGPSSGTVTTSFTDAVGANLDQCQNGTLANLGVPCGDSPLTGGAGWQNGDINKQNSQYREGDGLPYRTAITGLTNGTWTITLDYDFTKAGIFAIDRLTRFNLTQASNPCHDTSAVTCTVGSPAFTFTMPFDVASPGATAPALPSGGDVHTFNGLSPVLLSTKTNGADMTVWSDGCTATFVSAGQNNTGSQASSFTDNKVQQNGSAAGDSDRQFSFKVTLTGCPGGKGGNLMLGWTGHIASHSDWGTGKGAASISGAPFHMRVLGVDQGLGTSGGNQDRSVQLGAIVQTLTVKKVLSPVGSGTFDLQIDGTTKAAGVGDGGTTGPVVVDSGNHSVGELGAGGTSLSNFSSSISCVDDNGATVASGSGSSLATVPVNPGVNVVCTITNTQVLAHLTLIKQVTNNNGGTAQATDWTLSASGPTPFSGTTPASHDVNAGTYSLSESGPSGYTASAWVCVGGSQSGASVALTPGQSATCTITNDDNPPALHLRKVVTNDNGGTATVADFTLSASGPTPISGHSPVDSGVGFSAGTYALSETGPSGYSASAWSCSGGNQSGSNITLGIGESATCTITNDDNPPALHLRKVVTNDNGGTATVADFTLSASGPTPISGHSPVDSGAGFSAGSYALSETGPSGYSASAWVCVGGSQSGANITLGLGESATCTITNDDIAPKLHLRKVIVNNNGGTATQADFTLTATGPTPLSGHSPVDSGGGFSAGTYALSETGPSGYSASAWSCVGGNQSGSSITLGPAEEATCTITNDDIAPALHLRKVIVNDNGGTATQADFTLSASGPTPLSGHSPVDSGAGFSAGSYALSETGPSGYSASSWVCVGGNQTGANIALGLGESATCTITNDDIAPKLHLRKIVTNDNGGTATVADFTLSASGPTALSGHSPVDSGAGFSAGTYALSETGPSGYTASAWSCVGGNQSGSSITLGLAEEATCTITNDDNPPALHLRKVIVNDNGGTATQVDFTLTATGPTPISGHSPVDSGAGFSAGSYALSETGPSGYSASAWVCVGGTQTGSSIALGLGESATCTITNDDIAPKLHLRKVVVNDNGGTATVADFTLTAGGPTPISGHSPVDSGAGFSAGTYALSETGPSGYSASAWSCVGGNQSGSSITLAPAEEATCTITNDDTPPALHLRKVIVNDNGGTATQADFTLTAAGPTPISGHSPVDSGAGFSAGSYALSETGPSGYAASAWVCVGGNQTGSSIALGLGESATCTITNDDIAPKLHLRKVVVNDNGGTAVATAWTLNAAGPSSLTGSTPVDSGASFKAGTYSLSESGGPSAYTASAWVCVGGNQSGSSISLGLAEEATCTITNDDNPAHIVIVKNAKPQSGTFAFTTTGSSNGPGTSWPGSFNLSGDTTGGANSKSFTVDAGSYTVQESTQLGWILTGIGGSSDPNTPFNCVVTGSGGSSGVGDLNTQTVSITVKIGDTVTCTFENTGSGTTRTQGFWATHPQLAQIAWFGGTAFGHTFPGVAAVSGIGDATLCGRPIDTLGKLMGGFWAGVSKTSTGGKRSALDQARMQLLQQLLAAELNASAFGTAPSSGSFAAWESAYCGTNQNAIKTAQQQAASFNTSGDSGTFTPGTSADSKGARSVADLAFWDVLP